MMMTMTGDDDDDDEVDDDDDRMRMTLGHCRETAWRRTQDDVGSSGSLKSFFSGDFLGGTKPGQFTVSKTI